MDVVIFIGLGLALLWLFSRTPDADRPLAVVEPMERSWGLPITLALLGMLGVLGLGMLGGLSESSAYAAVEATGDADLLAGFSLSGIVAVLGGLMIVNGVARGLGVLLFVVGVVLNVAIVVGAGG